MTRGGACAIVEQQGILVPLHLVTSAGINPYLPAFELIDGGGQPDIAIRHRAGVMTGHAKIDAVPDAGELRMVVDFLRVQRDTGDEAERFVEILELEGADQRFAAVLERPAVRNVHRSSFSSPPAKAGVPLPLTRRGLEGKRDSRFRGNDGQP